MRKSIKPRSAILVATVGFTIGVFLISVLTLLVNDFEKQRLNLHLKQAINLRTADIENDLHDTVQTLYSVQSLFATVDSISREQFAIFVTPLLTRNSFIQSLNYISLVLHADRPAFERKMQKEFPHFLIKDRADSNELIPAPAQPAYLVYSYAEPYRGRENVVGFNSLPNKTLSAAMERARDTGTPSASPLVPLMTPNQNRQGLLIFLPVYRSGAPLENVEERRRNLVGYISAVIKINNFFTEILEHYEQTDQLPIDFSVYDASFPDEKALFFSRVKSSNAARFSFNAIDKNILQASNTINIAGRPWHIVGRLSNHNYVETHRGSLILFATGLLLSLIVAVYLYRAAAHSVGIQLLVEQRTQSLRQFVSDIAHEVRTPLAALQLQLQLLERSAGTEQRDMALNEMKRCLLRTTHLVQQLLILARLGPEAISISFSPIRLDTLLKEIVIEQATFAETKAIDLGMTQHTPAVIMGDKGLLRILLENLIGNAIRYTPDGGRVDIAVRSVSQQVIVEIDDTGPGISDEHLTRVFDHFYRVPGTTVVGSGLGLSIAKRIAELHHASITLMNISAKAGLRAQLIFTKHH